MKELSIEEKAKRYDDVIEELRGLLEGIHEDKCNIMEEDIIKILPELRESEDERIRKALIELIQGLYKGCCTEEARKERDMFLAWLEKQGKNNMGISEATKQELEDNLNKALEKETPESCNEFLEKQGEQKPTFEIKTPEESLGIDSDTYNKVVDECIYGDKVESNLLTVERAKEISPFMKSGFENEFSTWSEEDEKMLNDAIGAVGAADYYTYGDKQEIENWLKSLKDKVQPQPKQEWSERDEEEFQIAIDTLVEAGQNDSAHWLKCLKERYTWKPSNEQINALEYYIYSNSPTATITKGTIYGNLMVELLEQLKKLKGE